MVLHDSTVNLVGYNPGEVIVNSDESEIQLLDCMGNNKKCKGKCKPGPGPVIIVNSVLVQEFAYSPCPVTHSSTNTDN